MAHTCAMPCPIVPAPSTVTCSFASTLRARPGVARPGPIEARRAFLEEGSDPLVEIGSVERVQLRVHLELEDLGKGIAQAVADGPLHVGHDAGGRRRDLAGEAASR